MATDRAKRGDAQNGGAVLLVVAGAGGLLTAGGPALLAGLALTPLAGRHRRELAWAALAGLAFALLLSPLTLAQVGAVVDAALPLPELEWSAVWPPLVRWWLLAAPGAPA